MRGELARLKQPGKDILTFGGAGMAATLVRLGVIDEYNLAVNPVVLGSGRPLFSGLKEPLKLKLTKTRAYDSGIVALSYQPV